ncbi:MAG: 3-dehydroquinate synthase [Actinomycetota bacterium]
MDYRITVPLGDRSYDVVVGPGVLDGLDGLVSKAAGDFEKAAVIADATVDGLYGDRVEKMLSSTGTVQRFPVPAGEAAKTWETVGALLEKLASGRFHRHDLVVSLGGGAAGDLAGFVAACFLRGVRLVHIPTTLLAQVDASIGGKTGVNLQAGKNLAGAFYQPSLVVSDPTVLESLPEREFRSGMAEVVKYGLCYEPGMLDAVGGEDLRGSLEALTGLVASCAAIKARVISGDETDRGARAILNYGHTFGHALEAFGGYETWLHGEAISVGMVFAANVARHMGLLDDASVARHVEVLGGCGLPVTASFDPSEMPRFWEVDKKHGRALNWVLLERLARPVIRSDVPPEAIEAATKAVAA